MNPTYKLWGKRLTRLKNTLGINVPNVITHCGSYLGSYLACFTTIALVCLLFEVGHVTFSQAIKDPCYKVRAETYLNRTDSGNFIGYTEHYYFKLACVFNNNPTFENVGAIQQMSQREILESIK